ncbi:putative eka-like protein [Erysiphe necator]|uniref:Putative eka-like protein n=1 Tax=Uncinula necator TaxID=52586 RepID=A0A0B1PCJ3_UNCNE|nr:putative eka-like protein [Erysiphe necator]
MDISQESQALPTESSHLPSPIPPIPPIPNSPSPFAPPPPPPLNLEPSAKMTYGRQILKPVAPSKRPIIERPTPSSSNNFNTENAFLPKELADVIATRQRRERAWHARLMLCTTVISNIDSTLAAFIDDIEKEEAAALKAYIQVAIANFAASDSIPTPPKIPSHSRPKKSNGSSTTNDKNVMKKITIVTPRNLVGTALNNGKSQEAIKLPADIS